MNVNVNKATLRDVVGSSLIIALAIIIFFALLTLTVPTSLSLNARNGYLVPLIFSILVAFFLSLKNNSCSLMLSLSSMLILFALPLSALWTTGLSNGFVIGGLLPFSDAALYYNDANRLIEDGMFSAFSTARPLFIGFLAVVLKLTGGNLKLTLAILVLITALAICLATMQVRRSIGAAPAAVFMLICFLFYRRFIGAAVVGNLGMTLGVLGFALLWLSADEKKVTAAFYGVVLLTLGLIARPGAFFVLPMLILWMVIYFRDDKSWLSYKTLLVASACVMFGFAVNHILISVVGNPNGRAFSNFAYVLYGLVFGGNNHTAINNPPLEIIGLSGKALTDKLYQISIAAVIHNPFLLLPSILRAWKVYILKGYAFSFILPDNIIGNPNNPEIKKLFYPISNFQAHAQFVTPLVYIAVFHILSLAGAYWAYRNRTKGGSLIMAFLGGIFLSIPFAPPWDCDTGRVYAATIPVLAMMPSYGISNILSHFKKKGTFYENESTKKKQQIDFNLILILIFSVFLLLVSIGGPVAIKHTRSDAAANKMECTDGKEQLSLRLGSGSYITFVDNIGRNTAVPRIRIKDFTENLDRLTYLYPEIVAELSKLAANQNLFLHNKEYVYVVVDSKYIPDNLATIQLCGQKKQVKFMEIYFVH
jgi:hypothetical protein